MKTFLPGFDKAFESRIRLGIMSCLMLDGSIEFNELKSRLDATDGNLASHISALEKTGYISVKKEFVGKKPKTTYILTELGKKAFENHLDTLEKLIKGH